MHYSINNHICTLNFYVYFTLHNNLHVTLFVFLSFE